MYMLYYLTGSWKLSPVFLRCLCQCCICHALYSANAWTIWRYSTSHWPGVKQVHVRTASNRRQQIPDLNECGVSNAQIPTEKCSKSDQRLRLVDALVLSREV